MNLPELSDYINNKINDIDKEYTEMASRILRSFN